MAVVDKYDVFSRDNGDDDFPSAARYANRCELTCGDSIVANAVTIRIRYFVVILPLL